MSNKLVLYNLDYSPPVRAVKVVARLLGLELELRDLNLFKGDHLEDSFVKINPEHTVPTLVDDGFAIWDSHTICAYLVDKYAKDDSLYPKDLKLRARCNQRLFFDAASLFVRSRDSTVPIYHEGAVDVAKEKIDLIIAAYDILEAFLASDPFLVGQSVTIADISAATTVPFLDRFVPLDAAKHSNILAWLDRVNQAIPFFDEMNGKYKKEFHDLITVKLEENKQKQKQQQ